ncbi:MAG: hypothetical protein MZV63_30660 [Marinilabiliales bacterium]|nr:hypothetical protein [Marinilabiliales bacterium]
MTRFGQAFLEPSDRLPDPSRSGATEMPSKIRSTIRKMTINSPKPIFLNMAFLPDPLG